MTDALHDSGLEPVLAVEADDILSPGPVVEVVPQPRQRGVLKLGGKQYLVTAPKQLYIADLMVTLGGIMDDFASADAARRKRALAALREFLACVFSRDGHPADDWELERTCDSCDACAALRHLRSPSNDDDVESMSKSFARLMDEWARGEHVGAQGAVTADGGGNRAARRANKQRRG